MTRGMSDGITLVMYPIPWLLIIPLAWAVLSLLLPVRWVPRLAVPGVLAQTVVAFELWRQVADIGPKHYHIGDWQAPLGINLYADGLSATLLLLSALVLSAIAVYAVAAIRDAQTARYFWSLTWFVAAALNGIWMAADLFNLYVGLELLGLGAVGLVAISGKPAALAAAMRYLMATLFGSLLYLLGVALVYGATGTLALYDLGHYLEPGPTAVLACGLMTAGLLLKTALWPLHGWLPSAHGGALTPVSALLSALVVKASFFILLRLWLGADTALVTQAAAQMLGLMGAGAILCGGLLALRQERVKMVVAYSTVAQIGYLFLVFPLVIGMTPEVATLAWNGALLHLIAHAFAKAAMFLAVGNLILANNRDTVAGLVGSSQRVRSAAGVRGLGSGSSAGAPRKTMAATR
jgi:multicomponent Na+:H+ antiporter subunit D